MDKKFLHINELVLPKERVRMSEVYLMVKQLNPSSMLPLVIDNNYQILDGKKRYLACLYHGITLVPVIIKDPTPPLDRMEGEKITTVTLPLVVCHHPIC